MVCLTICLIQCEGSVSQTAGASLCVPPPLHPDGPLAWSAGVAVEAFQSELLILPSKVHKSVDFPTRDRNILDQVYANILGAYKAAPSPHLCSSDHISSHLGNYSILQTSNLLDQLLKMSKTGVRKPLHYYRTVLKTQPGKCSHREKTQRNTPYLWPI